MNVKNEEHSQANDTGDLLSLYLSYSCEAVISSIVHEVNTYNKLVGHWTDLLYQEPNLNNIQVTALSQNADVRDILEQVLTHNENISKVMETALEYLRIKADSESDS